MDHKIISCPNCGQEHFSGGISPETFKVLEERNYLPCKLTIESNNN